MFDGAVIGQTNMFPPTTVVMILTIAIDGLAVEQTLQDDVSCHQSGGQREVPPHPNPEQRAGM